MKRNAKIKLVPAETIVPGQTYVACLHGDTAVSNRTLVVVCDEQHQNSDEDDTGERHCFDCRFENGNTYPFLKEELYILVAEYNVPSLANPRKMIGTNVIELDWSDYKHTMKNVIANHAEVIINFDTNKAKIITNEKVFNLKEVIDILNEVKSLNENSTGDMVIDRKIKELKKNYLW